VVWLYFHQGPYLVILLFFFVCILLHSVTLYVAWLAS
jgi:hypothetical protein